MGESYGDAVIPRGVAGGSIARRDDAGRARRGSRRADPPSTGASTNVRRRVAVRARARGFLGFGASATPGVGKPRARGAIETPTRRAARRGGGADVGGAAFATPDVARFGARSIATTLCARLLNWTI